MSGEYEFKTQPGVDFTFETTEIADIWETPEGVAYYWRGSRRIKVWKDGEQWRVCAPEEEV